MITRIAFFNRLKSYNLFPVLLQHHVDGMNAILDEWDSNPAYTDKRWLAYILATVYHETARTMQPIEEYGKGKGKAYGSKLKMGAGPGKRIAYTTPDKLYYGRGHVQVTWYENYEALSKTAKAKLMGWNFLTNPELMLKMAPSVFATFYGMTTGLFTGRKLAHYFDGTKWDDVNARKIINGLDKADLIAVYARKFYECVK